MTGGASPRDGIRAALRRDTGPAGPGRRWPRRCSPATSRAPGQLAMAERIADAIERRRAPARRGGHRHRQDAGLPGAGAALGPQGGGQHRHQDAAGSDRDASTCRGCARSSTDGRARPAARVGGDEGPAATTSACGASPSATGSVARRRRPSWSASLAWVARRADRRPRRPGRAARRLAAVARGRGDAGDAHRRALPVLRDAAS